MTRPRPPMTRRVVLHVGLPKTGTTYLQTVLAHHRDALRETGVLYPFVRPQAMFLGAVEVRGSREKFGLTAEDVAGTWQALCDRVLSHAGTSVISHEILGGAEPDEIAAALAPLAGIEVDVVVTARDLGRQATAHWQEEVKLGDTRSFAELERDQLRADVPEGARPHFWHAQDYAAALRRWATAVPAERVHLVAGPPPGAPPDVLWHRFAEACGVSQEADAVVDADAVAPANRSLTTEAIALLREVNRQLDGRLTPREHARLVKRELAEGRLAERPGTPPRTPASLADVLMPAAAAWRSEVEAGRYAVHGSLDDLTPVLAGSGDPHPDAVPHGVPDPAEVADLVREVLQRAEALRVDSGHEGTGNSGRAAPPALSRAGRLRRRLGLHRDRPRRLGLLDGERHGQPERGDRDD
jgi:hypothetical protein